MSAGEGGGQQPSAEVESRVQLTALPGQVFKLE